MIGRALACGLVTLALCAGSEFDDVAAQATAARNANDVPKAVELYRRGLALNPSWQEGWWFLGTLLYDSDQYAPGQDAFDHVVALNPKAAPAWAFLGLCEFETKNYGKALTDIRRSLSLGDAPDPQMKNVLLFHQAMLLTRAGQFDQALQAYGTFLRAGAPTAQLLTGIGLASLHVRLVPADIPAAEQQMVADAGRTAAFALSGDYADADTQFGSLLATYPGNANVHVMRGVYLLARDPEAAVAEVMRAQQLAPADPDVNAMTAWLLLLRGDSKLALPYARRATEGAAETPFVDYVVGRALVETGEPAHGLEYMLKALQSDPENADVHIVMAAAYARLGKPAEAQRERQIALGITEKKRQVAQR